MTNSAPHSPWRRRTPAGSPSPCWSRCFYRARLPGFRRRCAARPGATVGAALPTWAMHWFTEMMAGRTERSQYAPAFAPQVTDAAVAVSRDLNRYGATPLRAEIVKTQKGW